MDINDTYLPLIVALASLIGLFTVKEGRGKTIALGLVLAFGLFSFGLGISYLANAGSINAILVFESAREPMLQSSFDHLHATLDPTMSQGITNLVFGSILLTFGLLGLRKKVS